MEKTALILTGRLMLLPTAARSHTKSELQQFIDISHAKGMAHASCTYKKLGWLTSDEAGSGIETAFDGYRKIYGLMLTKRLADIVLEDYPNAHPLSLLNTDK